VLLVATDLAETTAAALEARTRLVLSPRAERIVRRDVAVELNNLQLAYSSEAKQGLLRRCSLRSLVLQRIRSRGEHHGHQHKHRPG